MSAFPVVSAKFHQLRCPHRSFFNLLKHLENPSQNSLKINLNSFLLSRTHFKDEFATFHDVVVGDEHFVVGLAVEFDATDVAVFVGIVDGLDHEFATGHFHLSFIEDV